MLRDLVNFSRAETKGQLRAALGTRVLCETQDARPRSFRGGAISDAFNREQHRGRAGID
ncbi:MAG: hypothetical protein QOJ51_5185 [Acidobacteriaceae bacterium]|nr:hypothetical protein [Acidobacteriaceae bacterium]